MHKRKLLFWGAQVRNKQVTKHFTEKTIKEVWRDRLAERKAGRETEFTDFLSNHFQKRLGIMQAVVEVKLRLKLRRNAMLFHRNLHLKSKDFTSPGMP